MTIQEAISSAIEGGWNADMGYHHIGTEENGYSYVCHDQTLLDPKFWQALGKTQEVSDPRWRASYRFKVSDREVYSDGRRFGWFYYWYGLIDALAEGKTIEQYFESL